MASKSVRSGKSKGKSKQNNRLIMILTVIIVVILILAIVIISVKGMWGTVIDYVKSLLGLEETPNNPPLAQGVAKLEGAVLEMRVLDIGQGDCILLLFPDGQKMVMDIGSENGTPSPWNVLDENLKGLNITTIDYLFLSHTDYDHSRETKNLVDNYQIKNFYFPRADLDTSNTWKDAYNSAKAETYIEDGVTKNAEYHENIGQFVISGEKWTMKCYSFDEDKYPSIKGSSSAENKNSVSPICLLEYADKTIVLTGDANEKTEKYLLGKGYFDNVDADVLKVGHHGSKSSTTNDFLNKIDCEYAIISCGTGNKYKHPTPELLDRLDKYVDLVDDDDYNGFAKVYRTDEDGTITVQIDEKGVMNLIADEKPDKNTTTGTPYVEGEEINQTQTVAFIYSNKQEFGSDELAA